MNGISGGLAEWVPHYHRRRLHTALDPGSSWSGPVPPVRSPASSGQSCHNQIGLRRAPPRGCPPGGRSVISWMTAARVRFLRSTPLSIDQSGRRAATRNREAVEVLPDLRRGALERSQLAEICRLPARRIELGPFGFKSRPRGYARRCANCAIFPNEYWRRRPDLNRGWRFCRFRRVLYPVDSSCSLVTDVPRFSLVFGP